MPTQHITCVDCGSSFEFTEDDQMFYEDKGFVPPKRCRSCRIKKKNKANIERKVGDERPPYQHDSSEY